LAAATYNTILLALIWIGVIMGLGSQLAIASRTMIQAILIIFGGILTQNILLLPKFLAIINDVHKLESGGDRRASHISHSQLEMGLTPSGEGQVALLATQAASKLAKLTAEQEKTKSDFDSATAKYRAQEEALRRIKDKIEELEGIWMVLNFLQVFTRLSYFNLL
jgi:hypothetical protein